MNPTDPFGLIGQVLDGQFRVDRFVGEGGFSIVYRGHHAGLDEPIAIKCLKLPATLGSALVDSFLRKFRDESRLHYRLSQGNLAIARSIGSGTTMSPATSALVPYMALEWLEGRSLAQDFDLRRAEGREGRQLPEVVKLFDSAAQGLAFAHAQGVIHRDINPGNLFLAETRQGSMMKVLDFGVAKVINDHALELGPRAQTIGQIRIFAPAYGSPEQFDDAVGRIAATTDVYSFALILLEALRDRSVREGDHIGEFAMMALDANLRPTPRTLGIPVGDAVEGAFARATALRPEERPGDAGEFWGSLKHAIREDADSGRPPHADGAVVSRRQPWRPRAPAAGQAPADRPVTANMSTPVVEVSRPGSVAPSAPLPTHSQIRHETVRLASPEPPPVGALSPGPVVAASVSKATVVMGGQQTARIAPPPGGPTSMPDGSLDKTASMNAIQVPPNLARSQDGLAPGGGLTTTFAMSPVHQQQAAIDGTRAAYGGPPTPTPPPMPVSAEVSYPPRDSALDAARRAPTVPPPQPARGKAVPVVLALVLLAAAATAFAWVRAHRVAPLGAAVPVMSATTSSASAVAPAMLVPAAAATGAPVVPTPPPPSAAVAPAVASPTPPSLPAPPRSRASSVSADPPSSRGSLGLRASPTSRAATSSPPPTPTAAATPAPVAPGAFDPAAAHAALDVINGVLASCRRPGGKTGDGSVAVTFVPDGHVEHSVVEEGALLGTPEATCVASRFAQAHMAPFQGAPGTVTYSFHVPD